MPSSTPSVLDDALKIVQIAFYVIGAGVAVLTYQAARRGLLNTVNTEYQKRVIDRLQKLSEELYSEFDGSSKVHWAKSRPVHDAIEFINQVFENNKEEILANRKYYYGTPIPDDVKRLSLLLAPVVSDPFIPSSIRSVVVDLLENRVDVLSSIYIQEFEKYAGNLAKGKHPPLTELNDVNAIHNRIVIKLREQGCGSTAIEAEVHKIRALIQQHFESFDPHRGWWSRALVTGKGGPPQTG